uniref:Uncharacterized protein n=1 Tax=Timema bartmani TaxID=61472 RepID=A0A7R9EYD9_9NEOP|nr:unnamed protein product [Timema bartmani]
MVTTRSFKLEQKMFSVCCVYWRFNWLEPLPAFSLADTSQVQEPYILKSKNRLCSSPRAVYSQVQESSMLKSNNRLCSSPRVVYYHVQKSSMLKSKSRLCSSPRVVYSQVQESSILKSKRRLFSSSRVVYAQVQESSMLKSIDNGWLSTLARRLDADRRTVCGAQRVRTVKQQTPPSESSRPDRRAARLDWPVPSHWTGLNSLVFSWSLGARAATVLLLRAGVSSHPHRTLDLLTAGQQSRFPSYSRYFLEILTSLDLSNITITININITTNITSTTTTTSTTTSTSTTTTTTTIGHDIGPRGDVKCIGLHHFRFSADTDHDNMFMAAPDKQAEN